MICEIKIIKVHQKIQLYIYILALVVLNFNKPITIYNLSLYKQSYQIPKNQIENVTTKIKNIFFENFSYLLISIIYIFVNINSKKLFQIHSKMQNYSTLRRKKMNLER